MQNQRAAGIVLVGVAAAIAATVLYSQQSSSGSPLAVDTNGVSLRVRFGIVDKTPADWDGEVGGPVKAVRLWHARPGHTITGPNRWKVSTAQGPIFVRRPVEEDQLEPTEPYIQDAGLIVDSDGRSQLTFKTSQGEFTVRPDAIPASGSATFLNGRVAVDRVANAQSLTPSNMQADFATVLGGDNEVWTAWVSYRSGANEVHARRFANGSWEPLQTVSPKAGDIFLVKLGRDKQGRVWAIWSERVSETWNLYGRAWNGRSWTAAEKISDGPGPNMQHSVTTDSNGRLWVVWQAGNGKNFDIHARSYDGSRWSAPVVVAESAANEWEPAITADRAGNVYVAWDTYEKGNYDVMMRRFDGNAWQAPVAIANTPKFEAHVSLTCDRQNRVWAAWNESGFEWGKDTGFLVRKQATALYNTRWMSLAVYENSNWSEPASIEASLPETLRGYNDFPAVHIDANGRPWVFFRHRQNKFKDTPSYSPNHRAAWELWGVAYDGRNWSTPQFVPFSQGRQDAKFAVTNGPGGRMFAAWPTDNRNWQEFLFTNSDVYAGVLPVSGGAANPPVLSSRVVPKLNAWAQHEDEVADLKRIRGYEIRHAGNTYRIYRGDVHRHTEFSMDGNNDGSLFETYRYALDAASLDFLGVSDHNGAGGPDVEYVRYLGQQTADLFLLRPAFVPLFAYERSVVYPNGHRNILFAQRGVATLPIPASEQKAQTGAAMLYEYLKKNKGIAISHTSAGTMGTDWRDNDKDVEPLVEIYQGDRVSSEYEGAPKAAHPGNPSMQPGGYRPAGYIWNAWAKGYKLGVQSSSDHLSTHISYACTIAADFSRQGLLDAMRQRHSYGATDNIVLDYRMQFGGRELLQGDIAGKGSGPVKLDVKVLGTKAIRQVDVIRNNKFIHTRHPLEKDLTFSFLDADPIAGESYYYVRIQQVDDQMAWSSPIWIQR